MRIVTINGIVLGPVCQENLALSNDKLRNKDENKNTNNPPVIKIRVVFDRLLISFIFFIKRTLIFLLYSLS